VTRAPARTPSIEFSVVSGSNEDLIVRCIESLRETMRGAPYAWQLTATCNTPGSDLPERLKSTFPGIRVITNRAPRGFAANHNVVLERSAADYVWVLNDDLVFLPHTVERVTEFLEAGENAKVAALSPKLLNTDGSLQPSTYSFPSMPQTLLAHSGIREHSVVNRLVAAAAPILRRRVGSSRHWDHDRTVEVDTFRGACVVVRMKAVREVGPMAEASIVGAEEIEWHRRFMRAGWKMMFFAGASVIHHGSQTVDRDAEHRPEYLKGTLRYFRDGSSPMTYRLFSYALLAMFAVQRGVARLRGDTSLENVATRSARVTLDSLSHRADALSEQALTNDLAADRFARSKSRKS
jgi:GT2 family glycosyltransferase